MTPSRQQTMAVWANVLAVCLASAATTITIIACISPPLAPIGAAAAMQEIPAPPLYYFVFGAVVTLAVSIWDMIDRFGRREQLSGTPMTPHRYRRRYIALMLVAIVLALFTLVLTLRGLWHHEGAITNHPSFGGFGLKLSGIAFALVLLSMELCPLSPAARRTGTDLPGPPPSQCHES